MKKSALKEYRILYSAESANAIIEHEAAFTLRQKLAELFDIELNVSTDLSYEGAKILIGSITALTPTVNEYIIYQKDQETLALTAGSTAAYDDLLKDFLGIVEQGEEIPETPLAKVSRDKSIGRRYGDLRILFHNIFGYDRKPTINPGRRYAFEGILYREYDADILCLQEYDGGPRKYLGPKLIENGFTEVPADQMGFPKNCSPIFYNAARVKLLDHGFYPFVYKSEVFELVCNNHDTKNLTWAAFEDLRTQRRFLVISVHFYYSPDASNDMTNRVESNKARIENAREMFAFLQNTLYTKNGGEFAGLPLLWGGDLNCSYNNKSFPSLIASANGRIALDVLEEELGMKHVQKNAVIFSDNIGAYCGYPTYDEELGYYPTYGRLDNKTFDTSIDHAYIYGEGVTPLTFDIIDTTFAKKTSDHAPIVVDYRFD